MKIHELFFLKPFSNTIRYYLLALCFVLTSVSILPAQIVKYAPGESIDPVVLQQLNGLFPTQVDVDLNRQFPLDLNQEMQIPDIGVNTLLNYYNGALSTDYNLSDATLQQAISQLSSSVLRYMGGTNSNSWYLYSTILDLQGSVLNELHFINDDEREAYLAGIAPGFYNTHDIYIYEESSHLRSGLVQLDAGHLHSNAAVNTGFFDLFNAPEILFRGTSTRYNENNVFMNGSGQNVQLNNPVRHFIDLTESNQVTPVYVMRMFDPLNFVAAFGDATPWNVDATLRTSPALNSRMQNTFAQLDLCDNTEYNNVHDFILDFSREDIRRQIIKMVYEYFDHYASLSQGDIAQFQFYLNNTSDAEWNNFVTYAQGHSSFQDLTNQEILFEFGNELNFGWVYKYLPPDPSLNGVGCTNITLAGLGDYMASETMYADLCIEANTMIKQVFTSARTGVVGGNRGRNCDWMPELEANLGPNDFDAWILHYYPQFFPTGNLTEFDGLDPLNPGNENLMASQFNDLVRQFDLDGYHNPTAYANKPVWVTEFGTSWRADGLAPDYIGPATGSWFDMMVKMNYMNQFLARPAQFQTDIDNSALTGANLMYNTGMSNGAEPIEIEMLLFHTLTSPARGSIEVTLDAMGDVEYQFREQGLLQIILAKLTEDDHTLISPVNFTVDGNSDIIEDDGVTDGNYVSNTRNGMAYCPTNNLSTTIQAPLHYGWMARNDDDPDCLRYRYMLVNNSHEGVGISGMKDVNLQNADLFLFDADTYLDDVANLIVDNLPLMNISHDIVDQIQNEEVSALLNPDDYFCYYSGDINQFGVDFSNSITMPPYSVMLFEGDPGGISGTDIAYFGLDEVDTYQVSTNLTWNGHDRSTTEEIVIDADQTLTLINSTLRFATDAGITIMPGGQLVIENDNRLTSHNCQGSWRGITALGDAQNHTQNSNFHARITMNGVGNNSIIENAETGIRLGTVNPISGVGGDGGAWLEAQDVTFRNNRVDIDMKGYRRLNNQDDELPNRTNFDNCLFLTDPNILNGPLTPYIHVDMIGLWGIDFINCSWINESGVLFKDRGINAVCTTYDVFGENIAYGTPGDEYGTAFHGLSTAIHHNGYIIDFFRVAEMEFSNNYRAVYGLAATGNEFSFNNVRLANGNGRPSFPVGAWFINCDDLTLEENRFSASVPNSWWGYGTILDNGALNDVGNTYNDITRKNEYNDLGVGSCIRNDNRTDDGGGLQSKCNFYNNNLVDIYMQDESEWKDFQGSVPVGQNPDDVDDLTNNSFSHLESICEFNNTDFLIENYTGPAFTYFIFDNTIPANEITDPDCPADNGGVFRMDEESILSFGTPFIYNQHCPELIDPPMLVGGIADVQPWLDLYLLEKSAVNLLEITLNGGSGEDLIDAINDVYGNSSAFVRDLLLQSYPLSDEVLREVIERAIPLDSWHLTQVLLANAPLRSDVTAFLEDSEVLSPFFMGFIYQANQSGNANLRELLELEFAYRQQERWKAQQELVRNIQALPDDLQAAEYALYLSEKGGDQATGALIWLAYEAGDMTTVQNLSSQLADNSFATTLDIVLNSQESISETQWSDLYQAYLDEGSNFGLALSHLNAHSDSIIWPEFDPVPAAYKSREDKPKPSSYEAPGTLQIYPNPLSNEGYFSFDAEIGDAAEIRMYDLQGRLIEVIQTNDVGMVQFSSENWPAGFYTAGLYFKDRLMESVKFVKE